jgi:hypothetical protein
VARGRSPERDAKGEIQMSILFKLVLPGVLAGGLTLLVALGGIPGSDTGDHSSPFELGGPMTEGGGAYSEDDNAEHGTVFETPDGASAEEPGDENLDESDDADPEPAAPPAASGDGLVSIEHDEKLVGRLGRLVVAAPEGCRTGNRLALRNGKGELTYDYGKLSRAVLPGRFSIRVLGIQHGIEIRTRHVTRVRLGALKIVVPAGTRWGLRDETGKRELTYGYKSTVLGALPGRYVVRVLGGTEVVTVMPGIVTEF